MPENMDLSLSLCLRWILKKFSRWLKDAWYPAGIQTIAVEVAKAARGRPRFFVSRLTLENAQRGLRRFL